jgi:hypothetical protein
MTLLVARRSWASLQAGELQCNGNTNCEQTVSSQCDPLRQSILLALNDRQILLASWRKHLRSRTKEPTSVLGEAWTRDAAGNRSIRVCQTSLRQPIGVREMVSQILMDHTGDTRHIFDKQDRVEVAKAEQRFKELTGAGFTAAGVPAPANSGSSAHLVQRQMKPCFIRA